MRPLNLIDLARFVGRHGRALFVWALLFAVAGYLVSYLIPPTFEATAVILPPDEDELTAALSVSRRGGGGLGALTRLGGSYFTQADIALATLRSRSLHERLVRQFDLVRVYKVKTEETAVGVLRSRAQVRIATDGTITVIVRDRVSSRAAEIANAFLAELDAMNRDFRTAQARRTREFLEARVVQTDSLLRGYERSLAAYQARRGAVVLGPETRGAVDAASALMAQKISAEVELSMARRYSSPRSEELQRLESRVRELGRQIGSLPATQVGGAELLRQVAIQQQVLAILTANLEEARVREVMDTPTIQVLDPARAPERPKWPRRSWIAAFGAALGIVVGLALLFRNRLFAKTA